MRTSTRTLYRRFLRETGITFARWKQQARLLESIRRLAEGAPVTTVALDLGYESPSAFSTMFRRFKFPTPFQPSSLTSRIDDPLARKFTPNNLIDPLLRLLRTQRR